LAHKNGERVPVAAYGTERDLPATTTRSATIVAGQTAAVAGWLFSGCRLAGTWHAVLTRRALTTATGG
jgi:hypothetical protein